MGRSRVCRCLCVCCCFGCCWGGREGGGRVGSCTYANVLIGLSWDFHPHGVVEGGFEFGCRRFGKGKYRIVFCPYVERGLKSLEGCNLSRLIRIFARI